jgi:hypothetical protein
MFRGAEAGDSYRAEVTAIAIAIGGRIDQGCDGLANARAPSKAPVVVATTVTLVLDWNASR